mmetsp:Transcript_45966/g.142330  ORF Transcript_45966/g.142330 Transcript_45966/m.142330 type:complete len:396 (+) Transcript_45966:1-1188(+)
MHGTLLDSPAHLLIQIYEQVGLFSALLWLVFIFISSFTVLNMLIGILCEVVAQVSQAEKEESEVAFLKNNLLDILECYDTNNDQTIGEDEFDLLMQNVELHECLMRFGTNIPGIVSLKEVLFEGRVMGTASSPEGAKMKRVPRVLTFSDFMSVVLRLRGGHNARVTDIVELREYVRHHFDRLDTSLRSALPEHGPPPEARPLVEAASPRPQPVKVAVVSARGLRNADWLPGAGMSDVYCVCSVVGKPHLTTRTVTCNNTLSPVWNHQFELPGFQRGDCLQFDVMDRDMGFMKKDDSLGTATLSSSCFYPQGFDGELLLKNAGVGIRAYLKVFIPPAKLAHISVEQTLEMVMARMGEICAGQRQLHAEVSTLHEQIKQLRTQVAPASSPGSIMSAT